MHYREVNPAAAAGRVPLICLHQSPASGRPWEQFLAAIGRDRRVLAPDTPGFGDSDAPAVPPTIAEYAAAVGELLDGLGLGQVDLIGDHTGSKIAVELAQQRPHQIRKVVLHAAPIYGAAQAAAQQRLIVTKRSESWQPESGEHWRRRWHELRRHYDADAPLGLIDRDFAESLRARERSWFGYHAAYSYQHAENLPQLQQPVLILCTNDSLWDERQKARAFVKNGEVVSLPDWRVGSISRRADQLAAIVGKFLDRDAGARSTATPKPLPPARPSVAALADRTPFRRYAERPDARAGGGRRRQRAAAPVLSHESALRPLLRSADGRTCRSARRLRRRLTRRWRILQAAAPARYCRHCGRHGRPDRDARICQGRPPRRSHRHQDRDRNNTQNFPSHPPSGHEHRRRLFGRGATGLAGTHGFGRHPCRRRTHRPSVGSLSNSQSGKVDDRSDHLSLLRDPARRPVHVVGAACRQSLPVG
ncbi:MAG: alpha/beta hydrolase [Alphaproteobacteria bacterium]|nr:alpha/beta hydrolase [Alphaproteobacteria bacterium]